MSCVITLHASVVLPAWPQSTDHTTTVRFLVVDVSGKALSGWKVSAFKNNRDLSSRFTGLLGNQIPAGFYRYTLTGPASSPINPSWALALGGQIQVWRREEFVLVTATPDVLAGAALDTMGPPFSFVIRGKIQPPAQPADTAEPLRINLHRPIPSGSDIDLPVDASGEFRIYREPDGLWIATVIRGTEVLGVQPIFFAQQHRPASFALTISDHPTVIRVESTL